MAARTSEDGRDDGTGDPLAPGRAGRDHAGRTPPQLSTTRRDRESPAVPARGSCGRAPGSGSRSSACVGYRHPAAERGETPAARPLGGQGEEGQDRRTGCRNARALAGGRGDDGGATVPGPEGADQRCPDDLPDSRGRRPGTRQTIPADSRVVLESALKGTGLGDTTRNRLLAEPLPMAISDLEPFPLQGELLERGPHDGVQRHGRSNQPRRGGRPYALLAAPYRPAATHGRGNG